MQLLFILEERKALKLLLARIQAGSHRDLEEKGIARIFFPRRGREQSFDYFCVGEVRARRNSKRHLKSTDTLAAATSVPARDCTAAIVKSS